VVISLVTGKLVVHAFQTSLISAICLLFIRRGSDIHCQVTGNRRYLSDLPQGGLEMPADLIFINAKNNDGQKAKKLIEDTSNVKVTVSDVLVYACPTTFNSPPIVF